MTWRDDPSVSYFYPETYNPETENGTLKNLYGERDPQVLARFEYVETLGRATEVLRGNVTIPRTYDAEHVRAIHRYLFQDVYEWAGEFRTVNMFKGRSEFADVRTGQVDRYLGDVRQLVVARQWGRLDLDEFAVSSAEVFAYLNQAHPFREGNGRTSKVFMEHVAEQSRFAFDFSRVTSQVWNHASMLSGPDLGKYEPVPDSLVPVFRAVAVERSSSLLLSDDPAVRSRSPLSASYPKSPTQASGSSHSIPGQTLNGGPRGYVHGDPGIGR